MNQSDFLRMKQLGYKMRRNEDEKEEFKTLFEKWKNENKKLFF
jgi:hypothetical protein